MLDFDFHALTDCPAGNCLEGEAEYLVVYGGKRAAAYSGGCGPGVLLCGLLGNRLEQTVRDHPFVHQHILGSSRP